MKNIDEKTVKTAITDLAVERLVAALPQKELLPALGLVSKRELAEIIGIHYSTLRWHMDEGRLPRPTIRLVRRPYYTRAEAEAVAKVWKEKNVSWHKSIKAAQ